MLQGPAPIIAQARRLRSDMSLPEVLLWRILRAQPLGLKFRRQHPAGPYVADFYCHKARLIIAIDGASHDAPDRRSRDAARDRWFADRNLAVIRLPAADVLRDVDAAADAIVRAALPLHPAATRRGPPPHALHGEELIAGAA